MFHSNITELETLWAAYLPAVFLSLQVKHTNIKHNNNHHHRPLKIDESEPIDKKMKAAACGLDYMNLSLIAIDEHWKSLHVSVDLHYKLEKLTARLNSTIRSCTSLILKQCPNPPKPDFPKRHFEAKQWIGSFLHSSVKFLEQLIHDQPSWHQHKQ